MKKKILLLTALTSLGLSNLATAQVPNYVPTDGLVAYYPFNGNANDVSSNANNGTVNGATLTADRFGNPSSAYSFDGKRNYVNSTVGSQSVLTISLWYNSVYPINWYPLLFGIDNIEFTVIAGNHPSYIKDNVVGKIWSYPDVINSSSCIPNFNTWHHVVITHDNNTNIRKIYIDNILCNSGVTTKNIEIPDGFVTIGNTLSGTSQDGGAGFKGTIDDIGIWNRALTEQEIKNLYDANICYANITVTDTLVINIGLLSVNPLTYKNTITIAPNPAKDQITIDCGNLETVTGYQIKITNSLGQQIFTTPMNQQKFTVPLNTWGGTGLYFVNIVDAQGHTIDIKKILLE